MTDDGGAFAPDSHLAADAASASCKTAGITLQPCVFADYAFLAGSPCTESVNFTRDSPLTFSIGNKYTIFKLIVLPATEVYVNHNNISLQRNFLQCPVQPTLFVTWHPAEESRCLHSITREFLQTPW